MGENVAIYQRVSKLFTLLGGIYALIVLLLAVPFFQSHALYLNVVKLPWNAKFDTPEKYGLAPGKTANLAITTADNVTIGGWFILSDAYYHTLPFPPPPPTDLQISKALNSHPTILFLHGNAATRAIHLRVHYYTAFSSRLHANVFAIDYRGFGDSQGQPSEEGLAKDARAAWDWLISSGANPEDILIVGHSLGTGVATKLAVDLSESNTQFKGVVLMSPFSSIRSLVDTYLVLGLLPVMKPLKMIPHASDIYKSFIVHDFDTMSVIHNIKGSVLIVHAEDDWDISFTHSETLFDTLLDAHHLGTINLPHNPASWSQEEWTDYQAKAKERRALRDAIVARTELTNFGTLESFAVAENKVLLLKTNKGGHDRIAMQEGVHDVIRNVFYS